MRFRRGGCAVVLAVLSLVHPSVFARGVATVEVLVQDRARVTGPHLAGALATAERLFRTAGVRLVWRQATGGHERAAQFTIVLASEFDTHLKASLESNHIGIFLRPSQRAYVMYDRVARLGRKYHADAATMLGWAIAHEVGHLLLGDTHATAGVMAARLTPARFREEPFSAAERTFIRITASTFNARLDDHQGFSFTG